MPGVAWDDASKLRLLLLVIDKCDAKLSTDNWKAVANAMGGTVTASAVSQKFYKLKKESEQLASTTSGTRSGPTTPVTPKSGRGRKRKEVKEEEDGTPSQSKKKRTAKEKQTPNVKAEADPDLKVENDSEEGGLADENTEEGEE